MLGCWLGVFPGCRVFVPGGVGEGCERRRGEGSGCRSQEQWAGGSLRVVQYRAGVLHGGLPMQDGRCRDGQQTGEPYRPAVVLGIACRHLRKDRQLDTGKLHRQVILITAVGVARISYHPDSTGTHALGLPLIPAGDHAIDQQVAEWCDVIAHPCGVSQGVDPERAPARPGQPQQEVLRWLRPSEGDSSRRRG